MKRTLSVLLALLSVTAFAKDYSVTSPDGALKLSVSTGATTTYTLTVKGEKAINAARIAMVLEDGTVLGDNTAKASAKKGTKAEHIDAPFYRQASIDTKYNWLTLSAKDYSIEFRAYNDGVAYRFKTARKKNFTVRNEVVEYTFGGDYDLVVPYVQTRADRYETSFESLYTFQKNSENPKPGNLAFFPILAKMGAAGDLILSEADVEDYPGMFVTKTDGGFVGEFTPVPTETRFVGRGEHRPVGYSDVIAKVKGTRAFPWRIIGYAAEDKDVPVNNLTWEVAAPSRNSDISWIKPGLSSWDWWSDFQLDGVDFKSGINTDYYKFHIDFAAKYGLPYVILDEGWYNTTTLDVLNTIPEVNLPELCAYAADKNIKLVLWISFGLLERDLDNICSKYSQMGIAGFKVDFLDAQSQQAVNLVWRIAEGAAKYKMVLDFHGFYKPAGINKTWPNVLNFEGVFGLEQSKWTSEAASDMPKNEVTIPYLRQVAGPVDYTQGAMRNAAPGMFKDIFSQPMSQGTRAHQIALYVVFDSPFEMLCDTPSNYLREDETTRYIASIPTVFNSTFVQSGTVGEYIVTVREKDGKWYVGGATNREARDVKVSFDFLPEGSWNVQFYHDGINADRSGCDYKLETVQVNKDTVLDVHMAPGGGFAMIISK